MCDEIYERPIIFHICSSRFVPGTTNSRSRFSPPSTLSSPAPLELFLALLFSVTQILRTTRYLTTTNTSTVPSNTPNIAPTTSPTPFALFYCSSELEAVQGEHESDKKQTKRLTDPETDRHSTPSRRERHMSQQDTVPVRRRQESAYPSLRVGCAL